MIKSALHGLYRKYIQLHGVLATSARRAERARTPSRMLDLRQLALQRLCRSRRR